jgi:hypothetical protein
MNDCPVQCLCFLSWSKSFHLFCLLLEKGLVFDVFCCVGCIVTSLRNNASPPPPQSQEGAKKIMAQRCNQQGSYLQGSYFSWSWFFRIQKQARVSVGRSVGQCMTIGLTRTFRWRVREKETRGRRGVHYSPLKNQCLFCRST